MGAGAALWSRARTPQAVLAVGAVLLVTAAAALAWVHTGPIAKPVLLVAAGVMALLSVSVFGSAVRLRSPAETFAASAAVLGLVGVLADGRALSGEPVTALVMTGLFTAACVAAPALLAWPLAAWAAAQLGALRLLDELPAGVHTELRLGVALLGLALALRGRPTVARTALVTTAPWWVTAVWGGAADVWSGDQAGRWPTAVLLAAAGLLLVPARRRPALAPLLGPPRLVPAVGGVVAGIAVTGAVAPAGTGVLGLTGWLGVAVASGAALLPRGRLRSQLLPPAVAGGTAVAVLCTGRLAQGGEWGALSGLLLAIAAPPAIAALGRRSTRPVTVPVSVWCLAGSVLLALRAGILVAWVAALLPAALYASAMALGSGLEADVRRPTAAAAALTGVAAIVLPAVTGTRAVLLVVLGVQALATVLWAVRTGRVTGEDLATARAEDPVAEEISAGWRVGAAHLTVAGWVAAALWDWRLLEALTLPLAAGLLVAAGPRLRAASWPSWGPGLVVALAPSTLWAVLEPDGLRAVLTLASAVGVLVGGATSGRAAPLALGSGAAAVLVLGLVVPALPWPLAAALLAGAGLLALGTLREWRPVAGFKLRLAELR
jgi:hypothetical protein